MQGQCVYAADEGAKAGKGSHSMTSPDDMGDRIQKLEALVSSLVRPPPTASANGDGAAAASNQAAYAAHEAANGYPSIESALQPTAPYGAVVPTTEGNHFIGESHWEAVLRDVRPQICERH